jgi:hypothetical protein
MKYLLILLIVLCCFLSCKENNTNPSKPVLKENRLIVGIKDTTISNRVIPMDSIPIAKGVFFEVELAEILDSFYLKVEVFNSDNITVYLSNKTGKSVSYVTFMKCPLKFKGKYKVFCKVFNPDSIFFDNKTFIVY